METYGDLRAEHTAWVRTHLMRMAAGRESRDLRLSMLSQGDYVLLSDGDAGPMGEYRGLDAVTDT